MPRNGGGEPSWWYQPVGTAARVLRPVAALYGAIASRRMTRAPRNQARLPVICVGNFTAGGSGKTPFSIMLAHCLIARGERPVFLTRGYGGRLAGPHWVDSAADLAADVGDEPLLLARVAPVMVARRRDAGAAAIEQRGGATVIIMDDGLQNPSLAKDLSIAVVDGARGVGNGLVIPAGPLRAPLSVQLAQVDAIAVNGELVARLPDVLADRAGNTKLYATLLPSCDVNWLKGARVVAFAGIGNPDRFFQTLAALGATLVEAVPFPDHIPYRLTDAERLLALATRHQAILVTTEKDHARLAGQPTLAPLAAASHVLPVTMVLAASSRDDLTTLLDRVLPERRLAGRL